MKIIKKIKKDNGKRKIYLFGIKIFSYKKKSFKNKPAHPQILHINKAELDNELKSFNISGVSNKNKEKKIIISLTSFPQRMYDIHYCLYSLLTQSLKPDMVVLWLAEEDFPNKEKDIPNDVLKLKNNGLVINWTHNLRSYLKLIPALKMFKDDIIITSDDDIFYPKDWLKELYDAYLEKPDMVHGHRGHKVVFSEDGEIKPYLNWVHEVKNPEPSCLNFLTGVGGVLYPPQILDKAVLDEKQFMKLAPHADDVWFWAMAVKNNKKLNVIDSKFRCVYINPERELQLNGEFCLASLNVRNNKNDIQIKNVVDAYKLKNKLLKSSKQ